MLWRIRTARAVLFLTISRVIYGLTPSNFFWAHRRRTFIGFCGVAVYCYIVVRAYVRTGRFTSRKCTLVDGSWRVLAEHLKRLTQRRAWFARDRWRRPEHRVYALLSRENVVDAAVFDVFDRQNRTGPSQFRSTCVLSVLARSIPRARAFTKQRAYVWNGITRPGFVVRIIFIYSVAIASAGGGAISVFDLRLLFPPPCPPSPTS